MKTSVTSALAVLAAMATGPAFAEDAMIEPATPVVINGITVSEHDLPYVKARCEELYRASLDNQNGSETAAPTSDDQNGTDDQNGGSDDQNGGTDDQNGGSDQNGGTDQAGDTDQTPDTATSDTENPNGVDEAVTTFDLSILTLEMCQAAGLVPKP